MNKWLEKYSNGDIVQQNYNDVSVSLPEGFVGMGYNTKGRNYSPAWGGQFQDGGEIAQTGKTVPFEQWYKTVPKDKNDTTSYNLRRAYELAPQKELDAFVKNPKAHLMSVYEDPNTGIYEFMKSKNHSTIQKELDFYNSKKGTDFRNSYDLDTTNDFYRYVPKNKMVMGGSIPGAVGFTYARTNNPAPSNGKYAKKTMPSAQDGWVTKAANAEFSCAANPRSNLNQSYSEYCNPKKGLDKDEYKALKNELSSGSMKDLLNVEEYYVLKNLADNQNRKMSREDNAYSKYFDPSTGLVLSNLTTDLREEGNLRATNRMYPGRKNLLVNDVYQGILKDYNITTPQTPAQTKALLEKAYNIGYAIPKQKYGGWLEKYQGGGEEPLTKSSADWYKQWYEQRQALPQFSRVAGERLKLLSTLPKVQLSPLEELQKFGAVGEYIKNRGDDASQDIINLADPATVPAFAKKIGKSIDVNIATDPSVVGHEMSHWFDARAKQYMFKPRDSKSEPYEKYPFIKPTKFKKSGLDGKTYSWISDDDNPEVATGVKTEVNAILNELREKEGLRGDQSTTPEQLQKIIDKYMNLSEDELRGGSPKGSQNQRIRTLIKYMGGDPKKLSELNNTIAAIQKEDLPMAKHGGWLSKYDEGGEISPNCDTNALYHPITNPCGYKVKLTPGLLENTTQQITQSYNSSNFREQPLANSNSYIQQQQQQKINNTKRVEDNNLKNKILNQPQLKQTKEETPYERERRTALNSSYVGSNQYAALDDNGNITNRFAGRDITGKVYDSKANRQERMKPLIAAGAIAAGATGLPAVVSAAAPYVAATSAALNAPLLGTLGAEYGTGALTTQNLIGLGFGLTGASNLGSDINSGYYNSDAPLLEKIERGLITGMDMAFSPGVFKALFKALGMGYGATKNAYNTVATGESALPIAWKSPAVGLSQEASQKMFNSLVNSGKLTDAERALIVEYQHNSRPFTGRDVSVNLEKQQALNNIINKYNLNVGENTVLTRRFNPDNNSLGATFENGRLNFGDRPTSFSAGVGIEGYGSGANNRLVIPNKYAKRMGNNLLANQYSKLSEEALSLLPEEARGFSSWLGELSPSISAEREVLGTGLDFKRIGKVKNDIGGYDYIVKPSKQLLGSPNAASSVDDVGNLGNYQKILDKGLDIHDVRLKYHNNMILDFDEHSMINKFGKGNKSNYERALVEDIAGKMHTDDVAPTIGENLSGKKILEHFSGTEQAKVTIPNKNITPIENNSIIDFIGQEQNIIKPKKFKVPSFRSDPYQRTSTSRAADKWLEDWFTNPETKQKFIEYGGTEKEWTDVLNSLENPIKSNYKWGKNQPGGVYITPFNQASIPLDASVDIGVHEGIHKAKLLLSKENPILHRLWNDLTDAVRLTPAEAYPEIFRFRQKLGLKPGQTIDLKTMEDNIHLMSDGYSMNYKIKDKNKLLEIINKAPAVVPAAIGIGAALQQKKYGGIIKDNRGQWDHPGKITRIKGGNITMKPDPKTGKALTEPLLGISNTGERKMMYPGQDYQFEDDTEYVTEYPVAKNGVRQEQKGLQNLDDLLNFTNYNKPQPDRWLNKYN